MITEMSQNCISFEHYGEAQLTLIIVFPLLLSYSFKNITLKTRTHVIHLYRYRCLFILKIYH